MLQMSPGITVITHDFGCYIRKENAQSPPVLVKNKVLYIHFGSILSHHTRFLQCVTFFIEDQQIRSSYFLLELYRVRFCSLYFTWGNILKVKSRILYYCTYWLQEKGKSSAGDRSGISSKKGDKKWNVVCFAMFCWDNLTGYVFNLYFDLLLFV